MTYEEYIAKHLEPMRDDPKLRDLVQALADMMEAAHAEHQARDAYRGHPRNWEYDDGRSCIEERRKASEEFVKQLDEYIDGRIKAAIEASIVK